MTYNMNVPKKKKSNNNSKIFIGVGISVFLFIACFMMYSAVIDETNKEKIVGEWAGFGYTYTFTSDGKFSNEWCDDSGIEESSSFCSSGSYRIDGNMLTLYNATLRIDLFPSDADGSDGAAFIRQWSDEGNYDIRWKYRINFEKDMLYMDGVNVFDSPRLARKSD